MKFAISVSRGVVGNNIQVQVQAEAKEVIARVVTTLDNFGIGDDSLSPPSTSYDRTWIQVGSAGPHMDHTLTVVVTDGGGAQQSAVKKWQDPR